MSFTRKEAESVLSLINLDGGTVSAEVGAILIKLCDDHPTLFVPASGKAGVAVAKARKAREDGRKDANKRVAELVAEAQAAITKAEELAEQYSLTFSIDVSGMGGETYYGQDGGWSSSRC